MPDCSVVTIAEREQMQDTSSVMFAHELHAEQSGSCRMAIGIICDRFEICTHYVKYGVA